MDVGCRGLALSLPLMLLIAVSALPLAQADPGVAKADFGQASVGAETAADNQTLGADMAGNTTSANATRPAAVSSSEAVVDSSLAGGVPLPPAATDLVGSAEKMVEVINTMFAGNQGAAGILDKDPARCQCAARTPFGNFSNLPEENDTEAPPEDGPTAVQKNVTQEEGQEEQAAAPPAVEPDRRERAPPRSEDPPRKDLAPQTDGGPETILGAPDQAAVAVGAAVATVTLVGVLIYAAKWVVRYLPGGAALFSRVDRDTVLEHKTRRQLHRSIADNPGLSIKQLAELNDLHDSTVTYHLRFLAQYDLVRHENVGKGKHYFATSTPSNRRGHALLNQEKPRRICEFVSLTPGANQKRICEATGLVPSRAHAYLHQLQEAGLVRSARRGRSVYYYPTQELAQMQTTHPLAAEPVTPIGTASQG